MEKQEITVCGIPIFTSVLYNCISEWEMYYFFHNIYIDQKIQNNYNIMVKPISVQSLQML